MGYPHEILTDRIIRCFYEVYGGLGYGFLEKVYEHALVVELRLCKLSVEPQRQICVRYKGQTVGNYIADVVVERCVVLELKAAEALVDCYHNYLIKRQWQCALRSLLVHRMMQLPLTGSGRACECDAPQKELERQSLLLLPRVAV